jgi:hypothetical protein
MHIFYFIGYKKITYLPYSYFISQILKLELIQYLLVFELNQNETHANRNKE